MPTFRTTAMFSVVTCQTCIIVLCCLLSIYTIILCNSQNHTMNIFGHLDGDNSLR